MGHTASIYESLDREALLQELEPKNKGQYLEIKCPSCDKREAFLYHGGTTIKCNRSNNCNYSASIFDYVKEKKGYQSNLEVLKHLAEYSNYSLDITGFDEEKYQAKIARENILEHALEFFKVSLQASKEALGYLTDKRKYTEAEIRAIELGYLPSLKALNEYLINTVNKDYKDYYVNTVNPFSDNRLEGRLVIPYRDYLGRLQGFVFRALDSTEPKYLNTKGLKPSEQFFNLDKNKGEDNLVIVEGYLDALIATQRGLKGFVAVGKAIPSETQLDNAIKQGARYFTLALDQDQAGEGAIKRTLERINDRGARSFTLTLPEGYKDPDEYLRENKPEELRELLEHAPSGAKWIATSLLCKHSKQFLGFTDMEKRKIVTEGIEYWETLQDPIEAKDFIKELTTGLDIPKEQIQPLMKDYQERQAQKRQEQSYRELQNRASKLLNEGELGALTNLYREELPSITAKAVSRILEPYSLETFTLDIKAKSEGLKTGFNALDAYITIPTEAITIIAGRPSHGKTTLLLNMFLNCIKTYKDKRFFFFSYEETKKQLALKCITILSSEQIDRFQNLKHIENYIRADKTTNARIGQGQKDYSELTDSGRLWLIEEPYYINDLTDTISYLADRYNNIGAVFIDYIQKIKIKGKYQSRQVEIQKISEEILEVAKKAHLPIILGAQLNREAKDYKQAGLSNLRESGDIEQDANIVLSVYNPAMQEAEEAGSELIAEEVNLEIKILKNRGGVTGKKTELLFNRPLLTLEEKN